MKSISKTYIIDAPIDIVFEVLTTVEIIEIWTGSPAKMDSTGEFSLWGGDIHGRNNTVTRTKIQQDWKVKSWKAYSQVSIELAEISSNKTSVTLEHTLIPDEGFESVNQGWDDYYLQPVKELAEQEFEHRKTS